MLSYSAWVPDIVDEAAGNWILSRQRQNTSPTLDSASIDPRQVFTR